MVGYSKKSDKLTQFDFAFAGGASGFITRATCQPLDVLKIRFQLQVEPISHKTVSKYRSIYQAVGLILHEEGAKSFWKGHVPAQWLSITYGIVQFWTFEVLSKRIFKLHLNPNVSPLVNFTCGSVAGCMATLVSFPFDVIRTRLVAQSEQLKIYEGVLHAGLDICKKEGPLVLFRGLWPTIVQVGPHAGAQFMCYKIFDDLYKMFAKSTDTTLSSSLVAGSLAGLCAKTFIYPFDLVKKRLQVQGFEEGRRHFGQTFECRGLTDCLIRIYKVEGVPGYFKVQTKTSLFLHAVLLEHVQEIRLKREFSSFLLEMLTQLAKRASRKSDVLVCNAVNVYCSVMPKVPILPKLIFLPAL